MMIRKGLTLGIAAAAIALTGFSACANKNKTEADGNPAMAQNTEMQTDMATPSETPAPADVQAPAETSVTPDGAALEQPVPETADQNKDNAQPEADGYVTTPSGLKYKVIRKGTGRTPKATDIVRVNYEGKLLDGQVFDSSYTSGVPIEFPLYRVIPGWTEGLQLMQEGAIYEFYIPYQLAYGEQGTPGGPIPPKADLIFKVELIQVK